MSLMVSKMPSMVPARKTINPEQSNCQFQQSTWKNTSISAQTFYAYRGELFRNLVYAIVGSCKRLFRFPFDGCHMHILKQLQCLWELAPVLILGAVYLHQSANVHSSVKQPSHHLIFFYRKDTFI